MSAYNLLNGVHTSESYDLLTTVLRNDWGYKGIVVSDWNGGKDVVAQMNAGNDLLMPGLPTQFVSLFQVVKNGRLEEKVLRLHHRKR